MAARTFASFLKEFPKSVSILFGTAAGLPIFLFRGPFIPVNCWELLPIGLCVVTVCLFSSWKNADSLRRNFRYLLLALGIGLLGMFLLMATTVHKAEIGHLNLNPAGNHRPEYFLTGFSVDERGRTALSQCPAPVSLRNIGELIGECGPDRIPEIWGTSHAVARIAFGLSYFLSLGGLVIMAGLAIPGAARKRPSSKKPRNGLSRIPTVEKVAEKGSGDQL